MDARFLVEERTGVETYFHELLERMVTRGGEDEFVLFHSGGVQPRLSRGRWRSVEVGGPSWLWALTGTLQGERLDAFYSPVTAFPPSGAPRVVATVHDLSWHHTPESYAPLERLRQRRWTGLASRRAQRIVVVSETTGNDLATLFPEARGKMVTIPPGVDELYHRDISPEERRRVRQRYRLEGRFLMSLASFHPRKNLDTLVDAFDRFRAGTPERVQLLLAGRGGKGSAGLLSRIARSPHRQDILLPGYVPREDLPGLYAGADLFILISRSEGFGIPALEAMACRTPVLLSDLPIFREVCADAALRVDPADARAVAAAIAESIRDTPERGLRLAAGSLRARNYTWESSAAKLRDLLHDVAREAA